MEAITDQMKMALNLLASTGVSFYDVKDGRRELPCGCVFRGGFDTRTAEVTARIYPCATEGHRAVWDEVMKRWDDPDVLEAQGDLPVTDSAVKLFETIANERRSES